MLKRYFWNVLIGIDQLANAILFGDPDETISSRLGKWLELPKNTWRFKIARVVCWFLRKLDKNHCKNAVEKDEGKDSLL